MDMVKQLLKSCIELKASDLHLAVDTPPIFRVHGELKSLNAQKLSLEDIRAITTSLMDRNQNQAFHQDRAIDLAISVETGERFRVNIFFERGNESVAIRRLDDRFRSLQELYLPASLSGLTELDHGLVIVSGPTGSGKTTTLATLIHEINRSRPCHILTLEDPIEYMHQSLKALVRQRQMNSDFFTFHEALRSAMREDPDVILVGEMRDLETMRAAIFAAETGHLIFTTLHSGDAVGAIERIVGMFPDREQEPICLQLSLTLKAVVAQKLLPCENGKGRVPAVEVLMATSAVSNLIRTRKSQQIYSAMESGSSLGMQTFEQSLARLVSKKTISDDTARRLVRDRDTYERYLRMQGTNQPLAGVSR